MKSHRHDFHSVILSDIHLGTRDSKAEEAIAFLKATTCRKLILNGDIVDGWALRSGGRWLPVDTKFVRTVLKKMEKQGTEVIYLRGNHDDILERFFMDRKETGPLLARREVDFVDHTEARVPVAAV